MKRLRRLRSKALLLGLAAALALSLVSFAAYAFFLSGLRVEPPPYRIDWRIHPAIVFESDDWGKVQLFDDRETLDEGVRLIPKDWATNYRKYLTDTLESAFDMEALFAVLKKHRGGDGIPVVFVANYVMCSPDYTEIRNNDFRAFFHQVLPSVPGRWRRGDFLSKAKEGIAAGVWEPEYHGMLHMNPYVWTELLRSRDTSTLGLFELESYAGMNGFNSLEYAPGLSDEQQAALIDNGVAAFRKVFGRPPASSIAPNYRWQQRTETLLSQKGVSIIQAKNAQNLLNRTLLHKFAGKILNIFGYKAADKPSELDMGERNARTGVLYLVRNVKFEPLIYGDEPLIYGDVVDNTISAIKAAWSSGRPAIISSHRFNFVSVRSSDRELNIRRLDELLRRIRDQRPDVVFLTDRELAQIYSRGYSARHFGERIVIRNFTGEIRTVDVNLQEDTRISETYCFPREEVTAEVPPTDNRLVVPPHTTCVVRTTSPSLVGASPIYRN